MLRLYGSLPSFSAFKAMPGKNIWTLKIRGTVPDIILSADEVLEVCPYRRVALAVYVHQVEIVRVINGMSKKFESRRDDSFPINFRLPTWKFYILYVYRLYVHCLYVLSVGDHLLRNIQMITRLCFSNNKTWRTVPRLGSWFYEARRGQ